MSTPWSSRSAKHANREVCGVVQRGKHAKFADSLTLLHRTTAGASKRLWVNLETPEQIERQVSQILLLILFIKR